MQKLDLPVIIKGIPAKREKRTPEIDETNKVSVMPILPPVFSSISPPKAMAPDKQAKNINAAEDKALAFKPSLK